MQSPVTGRCAWLLACAALGCSGSAVQAGPGPGGAGTAGLNAGGNGGTSGAAAGGNGSGAAENPGAGAAGITGGTPTGGQTGVGGVGGVSPGGSAGAAGSGGADPSNPGNYPNPPRAIHAMGSDRVSIGFAPSAADAAASGSQHTGEFDPRKPIQAKLVLPLGGVNSDPWKMGWAVDRGYHVLTVDLWNDYPKDPGYPEYLESWSGMDESPGLNQPAANSVMARVKAGLKYLDGQDPASDWGYYLDANDNVRWNDVIVFGYSFGGQMGVAASKYVPASQIIITSAPNVPIDSPWLKRPNVTPPERCYFLGGNKDGEHTTHKAETELLGWPGDVLNVTHLPPPYATNRLEVDDGHSSFCGRPFADGMVDWDSICEFMFHTRK